MYREFSTKNADYVLRLGNHKLRNRHDPKMFDGCDAIVLESVGRLADYIG